MGVNKYLISFLIIISTAACSGGVVSEDSQISDNDAAVVADGAQYVTETSADSQVSIVADTQSDTAVTVQEAGPSQPDSTVSVNDIGINADTSDVPKPEPITLTCKQFADYISVVGEPGIEMMCTGPKYVQQNVTYSDQSTSLCTITNVIAILDGKSLTNDQAQCKSLLINQNMLRIVNGKLLPNFEECINQANIAAALSMGISPTANHFTDGDKCTPIVAKQFMCYNNCTAECVQLNNDFATLLVAQSDMAVMSTFRRAISLCALGPVHEIFNESDVDPKNGFTCERGGVTGCNANARPKYVGVGRTDSLSVGWSKNDIISMMSSVNRSASVYSIMVLLHKDMMQSIIKNAL